MSTNRIPDNFGKVTLLTARCIEGALREGGSIPLTINTAALIAADFEVLTGAQAPYEENRALLEAAYRNYHEVLGECYDWSQMTRDYLKRYLGKSFDTSWVPAGFQNSLAIKRGDSFLYPLLGALKSFFTTHADWQDEPHEITAAKAQAARDVLLSASTAVSQARLACAASKHARDAAYAAMRRRLSGLCIELKLRIGLNDPRWLAFGLNIPGTPSIPDVPKNLRAVSYEQGEILATCDEAPRATHYRFYTQVNLEQPEPVFVGHSPAPTLVISNIEPDQNYQVFVSAVNEAGESNLSEPAEVTLLALQKAA